MPDRLGPRLRDAADRSTWPTTTPRMPKWNSGLPDAQQPVLVELGGAGGPAELVVAVAPEVADHEDRRGRGRERPPSRNLSIGALPGRSASAAAAVAGSRQAGAELRAWRTARARPPPRAAPRRRAGGRRRARRRAAAAASRRPPRRRRPTASRRRARTAAAAPARRGGRAAAAGPGRWSTVAAYSSTTHRWSGSSASSSTKPERR